MSAADMMMTDEDIEAIVQRIAEGGSLKDAARLSDAEVEAIYAAAYNFYRAAKHEKAARLFAFLCLYDHNEPRWFYGLGVAKQAQGDYRGAVNSFVRAAVLGQDDPLPQLQAGYCFMALGQWEDAKEALDGAVEACRDESPDSRRHLAEVRRQAEGMLQTVAARLNEKERPR